MRTSILFLVAMMVSLSAIALDFNQTQRLANQGDAMAQYNLGLMYYYSKEGVRQDYAKACEWYLKAANQGNTNAQYSLGVMYNDGKGVRQDYNKAREWYLRAASQGDAMAQYNIGVLYNNGEGVQQTYTIAKKYFGKACDNGLQVGCDQYKKLNQKK